ncbi:MAG: hypothetical protein K2X41_01270 [Hyphomicrobium sp.]|nr:hypothetical protein [Hyphomicrobium sp.]
MNQDEQDGITTIRQRYQRRTQSISMVGLIALIVVTVVIGTYMAFFV